MSRLIKILFSLNLLDRNWYQVIGWWETRRLVYNAALIIFGLISLLIFLFVLNFDPNIIQPFSIIFFIICANFFYTFGWVVELIIRLFNTRKATSFALKSFKIGLIFSIVLTFFPTLFFSIHWVWTGKKFSSPYSNYTKIKPNYFHLSGTYYFINEKNSRTSISEKDKQKEIYINLKSNGTFSMNNIPVFGFEQDQNYELWSGKGSWRLNLYDDIWKVTLECDTLYTSDFMPISQDGFFTNDFYIFNDNPPYKLYQIIGDPDGWNGVLYGRKN